MTKTANIFIFFVCLFFSMLNCSDPKISIITSVYEGDEFIEGFLADITRQTVFGQCELIIINANSSGHEEPVIKKYMAQYPNIIYFRLDSDPGIYGVWNMAIKMSHGTYITNANIDDRLEEHCYEIHAQALDEYPEIMLVYSNRYLTTIPNETFEHHSSNMLINSPEFSRENMFFCLPGCNPMWRKSLHDSYGFFDPGYKSSGDFEMWLRAVEEGAQFKKVPGCYCLCYENPQGLSTRINTKRYSETQKLIGRYGHIWKNKDYMEYYELARKLDKFSHQDTQQWPLALDYYLKAYASDPNRAEPLIHIAQHYHAAGDMALTYLFAHHACGLPLPEISYTDEDINNIYRYTRYDLLGIAAWYVQEFEIGESAIKIALQFNPDNERLKSNLQFYLDRKK